MNIKQQLTGKQLSRFSIGFTLMYAAIGCALHPHCGFSFLQLTTMCILAVIILILAYSFLLTNFASMLSTRCDYKPIAPSVSFDQQNVNTVDKADNKAQSVIDKYEENLNASIRQSVERRTRTIEAINEYVMDVTTGYLSKKGLATLLANIEKLANGLYDEYEAIRSDMENTLKSPDLRHLAWNIGERLNVPRRERAKFILASFPVILKDATIEYLERNLRDSVVSNIIIDVPDKGDYKFHYRQNEVS